MVFRFTTSTILALIILSFSTSPVYVPHQGETTSRILPSHLPLAAVNGPQRTIVITVQFPDKGNGSSPRQILTMLSNLNNYYNEDSYGTVSFQSGMTPPVSSSWYTLPNALTFILSRFQDTFSIPRPWCPTGSRHPWWPNRIPQGFTATKPATCSGCLTFTI